MAAGLEMEAQVAVFHGAAQLGSGALHVAGGLAHGLVKAASHIAPVRLGPVHGLVGAADQGGHVQPVIRIPGDADAGPQPVFHLADADRFLQGLERLHGEEDAAFLFLQVRHQDDKFVPAEAAHRVGLAENVFQTLGHPLQHLVPDPVAVGVVDGLEPVQVQEQHPQQGVLPVGPGDFLAAPVFQQGAVGQAGEGVVEEAHGEGLLARGLADEHVGKEHHVEAPGFLGGAECAGDDPAPHPAAVLAP